MAPLERILDEQLQAIGNAGNEKAPDRFLRDDILLITILVAFLEASAHQIRSRSLELALLLKLIGSDCYWYRTFSPRLANISPPAFALSQHDGAADQKRRQSVRRCHQLLLELPKFKPFQRAIRNTNQLSMRKQHQHYEYCSRFNS